MANDKNNKGPDLSQTKSGTEIVKGTPPLVEDYDQKNSKYKVDEQGTLVNDTKDYTGYRPNSSKKAKNDKRLSEQKERAQERKHKELLKKQKKLRHAGY